MQLVADDLLCPSCQGYVHLFLDHCPACGTERVSRFGQATATGALGARALLEDEQTQRSVHFVVLRYTLRSSEAWSISELEKAFGVVAGSLAYRTALATDGAAAGDGPKTLDGARLVPVEGSIAVRAGPSGRAVVAIPFEAVLAATPIVKGIPAAESWAGVALGDRRLLPSRPLPDGDLLVTFSAGGSAGQLAVANRRGLLAQTARPDHYVTLARWIGFLGAAAAEARWLAAGTAAYAAELGLGAPVQPSGRAAAGGASAGGAPDGAEAVARAADLAEAVGGAAEAAPAILSPITTPVPPAVPAPATGVRAALEELEGLRAAGLVTTEEYEAKRREILARL